MSLRTISARHIRLIASYWIRYVVRSGAGLVFLLIALVFSLSVAHIIIMPVEQIMVQQSESGQEPNREKIITTIVELSRPVIRWTLGIKSDEDDTLFAEMKQGVSSPPHEGQMMEHIIPQAQPSTHPWTKFLLDERPALLSIIFLILIFSMPFLIAFLAFNQISGDVQSLGLRYVLLRTERANIFIGRFLGTALFSTLVIAVIIATITFYLGVKIKIYPAGPLAVWALHGFLALTISTLPYIALCSWISTLVDSPFLSLVIAKIVIGGVLLLAFLGSLVWRPMIYLNFALPWGIQNYLLHPQLTHSLGTTLACLAYMMVFLFLGYYRFETRDL